MTDRELIEALKDCSEYPGCEHCPLCGVIECTYVAASRLEAMLDENENLKKLLILQKQQLLEIREANVERLSFTAGAMAMQEAALDILNRMAENTNGMASATIRWAMKEINKLEVEHEQ